MKFHTLKINEVEQNTPNAVSIHFEVPSEIEETFEYQPGQYLIVQVEIENEKYRRAYSLCSSPVIDDDLVVTSKRVEDGKVSNYLNDNIEKGDTIEVYPPQGNFVPDLDPGNEKHYVLLGAGSGITPLMSILQTILVQELKSKVTLFYGNRDEENIIFRKKLEQLKEKFGEERFTIVHSLSQPSDDWDGMKGRLSKFKIKRLTKKQVGEDQLAKAEYFVCGPPGMREGAVSALENQDIPEEKIHVEYFTAPLPELDDEADEKTESETKEKTASTGENGATEAIDFADLDEEVEPQTVTIILNDEEHELTVQPDETILEAAINEELDPPFACQMGICTTCRATLHSGRIAMEAREGLSDDEVEEGFILTCQSHPLTDDVVVEYG